MTKFLITSALPYVNGVKHLGNLAGSLLPADIHARFRRQTGHDVLFLCGTDEHGTPAELAAAAASLPVADYCARQHMIQAEIYRRFGLSFDHFSRTSGAANHRLTQEIFARLDAAGYIEERTLRQAYSPTDRRFLPDRYVIGTCPHCGHPAARGDQCESCTRLIDPHELSEPRSAISGARDIEFRETRHLFLKLAAFEGRLRCWIDARHDWPPLVQSIARKWLDEGLRDRCITRDLTWGVPVPKTGFADKVFYVWFDAPIGYIAAGVEWAEQAPGRDWRAWWQGGDEVRYLQFLAKDNVPFHAVSFPATLLGSGLPLKRVDIIKGFNWLTFEGGKFSTSEGRGIFTDRALELLPADTWRWWLAANAPEGDDVDFTVERFVDGINKDLADTFGNLVNRCLSFVANRFDGKVPDGGAGGASERDLAAALDRHLAHLRAHHEALAFRKAADEVRSIWKLANAYLAHAAPWSAIKQDPPRAAAIARTGINLVRLAALVGWPFIPFAAAEVLQCLGDGIDRVAWPDRAREDLCAIPAGRPIKLPPPLFPKISREALAANVAGRRPA
ncbi:MAG: methionine--tRNA ligase [Alphaproteobacteria bacterium]|nr:methionine--tRNA ligase [Alphaproteobacteria bacterium]MBV8407296.1 methionine--tRNA ligase [Alphaproteobacteria bacterium]